MNTAATIDNTTKQVTKLVLEPMGEDDEAFLTALHNAVRFGREIIVSLGDGTYRKFTNGLIEDDEVDEPDDPDDFEEFT